MRYKLTALLLSLFMLFSVSASAAEQVQITPVELHRSDFIRGMDVSSVLALEQSGVRYYNENNEEEDLFKILSDHGVNYIRVRVWNEPYDEQGHGYGGGNNDVSAASEIGKRAAAYGMKLLVDFHYSDFWADPAKQKAPKAWSNFSLSEKEKALYSFTLTSLNTIRSAGADIGMVQIGNETTTGIAGESDFASMAKLFNAGSRAVRDFDSAVKVALHFTNPERSGHVRFLSDSLYQYQVDYDVYATSYYPNWHGSLSNLTSVLNYVADTYGKEVMVAETAYAYTLNDTDGFSNTITQWNSSGENMLWDFTPQGLADEVKAVMNAVNAVDNGRGLGVFYWEGAWITVGDITGLSGDEYYKQVESNRLLWKKNGAGWASSYSAAYDPDDAGKYYGGSSVDNQAFFDAHGKVMDSLNVFRANTQITGDADGNGRVDVEDVTAIQRATASLVSLNIIVADVNGDGAVNISDATELQRYIAGYPSLYPIGKSILEVTT